MPERTIVPEVIEPDEKLPADLVALRKFALLMDEALPIPGTRRRIGLDAGLGLIPGIGDAVAAVLSAWIVAGALRHRVPLRRVVQMVWNIVVDLVIGAVPILGDVFDFAFEENVINMRILMRYRNRRLPPRSTGEIAAVMAMIVLLLLAVAVLAVGAAVAGVLWLIAQRHA